MPVPVPVPDPHPDHPLDIPPHRQLYEAVLCQSPALSLAALLWACGSPATEPHTELLLAEVHGDLPEEERRFLVGVLRAEPVEVAFPDGEGSVTVAVTSARVATADENGTRQVRTDGPATHIRSIEVLAADAAGYELSAAIAGNPTNSGTPEVPIHTRLVQVTRNKSGLMGTSMGQMIIECRTNGVERQ